MLERIEESARWVEQRRKGVSFTPGKLGAVEDWEREVKYKVEDSPLGRYVKVQRKTREKRRKLVEKVSACDTYPLCLLAEWGFSDRDLHRLEKARTRS